MGSSLRRHSGVGRLGPSSLSVDLGQLVGVETESECAHARAGLVTSSGVGGVASARGT